MNSGDPIPCSSPRISFSHDIQEDRPKEPQVMRLDQLLLADSNPNGSDFNFCVNAERETCHADELFFNGFLIPTQMRQKVNVITNEEITSMTKATLLREEKGTVSHSRSFWRFQRSSSLNCEKQSVSIWSNLPLLLRSKSTGSSSISQNGCSSTQPKKQNHKNSAKFSNRLPPQCQKPGGKMARNSSSSVLNVPPPYIAKGTSDLLGFGNLFRNGSRERKSKK